MKQTQRRMRRTVVVVLGLLLLVLGVAACGSDDSSDTSSSPGSSTASGDTGGSGGGSANVDEAKQIVEKAMQRPTELPVTEPVGKPIPGGKTVEFVSCGGPVCSAEADALREAANILGWKLIGHDTDGTPQAYKAAFNKIIRDKPDGVAYCAIDSGIIGPQLKQLEEMGVFVSACATTDPVGTDGIDFVIDTPEQLGRVGGAMAAWIVADSGGDADTVVVNVPDFKINDQIKERFMAEYERLCPDCKAETLDVPFSSLAAGQAPNRIVSYLRSHPDTKYVALVYDGPGAGLPAALKAAGLDDVKYIGQSPGPDTVQNVISGAQAADGQFAMYEDMYSMIDAMARKFAGAEVIQDVESPVWLTDKSNMPPEKLWYPLVEGVDQKFAELWGKN